MKIKIVLCLCMAVCLTALGVSGYIIWNDYAQRQGDQQEFEELSRQTTLAATLDEATNPTSESTTLDEDAAARADEQEFVQLSGDTYRNNVHDFKSLRNLNSDCVAWLTIPWTTIDYPVMHTPNDPEKYLNRNFYGDYSVSGVPFLDAGCTLYGTNMIIYGHDMSGGTMFAPLLNYMTKSYAQNHANYMTKSYAQNHAVIQLETEQGEKVYTVYCAARVKSTDMFYNLKDAPNQAYFDQKVKDISQRALFTIGSQPKYGQKLLTLSTCANTGQDDRFILIAVQK